MYQLLVSGNLQHTQEQAWILHLLAAGLRGALDAQLYRRRFVIELLMSLYDSPLSTAYTRRLALHTISAVAFVPAYAKDLTQRAGMLVNQTCTSALGCVIAQHPTRERMHAGRLPSVC